MLLPPKGKPGEATFPAVIPSVGMNRGNQKTQRKPEILSQLSLPKSVYLLQEDRVENIFNYKQKAISKSQGFLMSTVKYLTSEKRPWGSDDQISGVKQVST